MVQSIIEAVALNAEKNPDKLCAADVRYELTYRQFWEYVYGYSNHLKDEGIKKGDYIVVRNTQNVVQLITGLAITLAGAIYVPIEKNVADSRILEIINEVSAKYYIAAKKTEVPCTFERITEVMKYKDEKADYKLVTFPSSEDIAEILFTTGTTGKSKGIVLSHKNVVAVAGNVIDGVEMKKDNVEMIPSPLSHSHGLRRFYANMLNGSSVVIIGSIVLMQNFYECMEKYRVTALDLVPAALSSIFKLSEDQLGDYKDQIDYVQLGSAPIPEADRDRLRRLLPNSRIYNFYGTTESGCSCILDVSKYPNKKRCIGKPTCNSNFVFINESGELMCPTKEKPGYLACAGDMNMLGYYHDNELTNSIMKNGYIKTEDLAYVDEDGFICLLGRKSDVIVIGGNKVSPSEVEDVANMYDGIEECACVPVDSDILGKEPKLFVVLKDGFKFNKDDIYQFLKGKLEKYKVPKIIVEIEKLPRSFNGKILRRELI